MDNKIITFKGTKQTRSKAIYSLIEDVVDKFLVSGDSQPGDSLSEYIKELKFTNKLLNKSVEAEVIDWIKDNLLKYRSLLMDRKNVNKLWKEVENEIDIISSTSNPKYYRQIEFDKKNRDIRNIDTIIQDFMNNLDKQ